MKKYSDTVRDGKNVDSIIPGVGRFSVKNRVAGVIFEKALIEQSVGSTVRNHESMFIKNNWMNNKLYEPNVTNYGFNALTLDEAGMRNMRTSVDAKSWLKNNLDIDYDKLDTKMVSSSVR